MMSCREVFESLARELKTPYQVQKYIQSLEYNKEESGATLRSALGVYKAGKAHCIEAAFLAAAILEVRGYPPLVCDLESKDGLDHVLYVFKESGRWGAIGRSRDVGLEGRAPIFRSIRDLSWSYFDPYIDHSGCVTAYELVHLDDTKANWRCSPRNVWKAEDYLLSIPHRKLRASKARYNKIFLWVKDGKPLKEEKYWW